MNEGQDEASSQGQQLDQLQQELHAKELLLETLRYENNNLKQYSDRHYDPASTPDWKNYDALKRKVVEYQKALEQRDHIIGQMEAGFKQLMHKNVEAEAKGRKAEEHYSGEIQTLAQQVQELTAQLTITSHQHQAAMKAAQDHFSQQLAASQKQMRDQHGSELASLREQHASEMTGMTLQVESLEKSHREEHHKLVEHLTHLSNSLGAQLEEEKGKVLGLQREKEEWEVHKKELEAESEERENLRRSLNEQITVREDLQEKLRQQFGRQLEEERKMENLQNVSESLSEDLKAENEKRKIVEGKLEEEMKNARKWFEEKTALEVNQKQVVLQLQVAEEELAKAVASSVSNCEKLERLDQENEVLIKDKESLSKENKNLTLEKELLEKEREKLISENQSLTKEKESLTSNNEVLTKEKDFLTLHSEALTKEKETLASEYKMLTKEKEAIALEKSRILADKKIKEKEKQCLAKEVETLTKFKDSLITEKDILLKEKQDSTVEKDLWTREKEALLAETEAWATEKENLLLEKESLLLEKKNHVSEREILVKENAALSRQLEVLSAEKEEGTKDKEKLTACIDTLMSEKSALLKEKDALLCEKELLISEKKTFSSEKIIWSKDKQNLSYEIDALCTEKKCWSQKEELLSKKNESLNAENKDLTEQNKNLGNEKEHLLEQNRSLSNEKEVLTEEREILMKQVQDLTTERESVVQLMEEVRSLGEVVEAGQVERKRLEDVCASKEAELEQLKEKYTQTLASKESDFKELEESYKKKLLSKDIELQELEENFKEKFSLKEKEIKELEEMYEKKCSQKDNELQELLERIALKESELEELKKKDRKMEILHENCLGLLEHLQSGEEERKKIEEECEDKCEMLNTVLRKVDVKLCEATSLVSKQRVSAGEKMQRAGPRSNLEEAPSKLRESETPHISMDRSKCEREMESCKLLEELHYVKEKLEAGKKNEEDLTKQLTLSEKEKKQLANEVEVMRQKIHDQHFTITSLQNEKSRLGQHIMQLEGERSSLRAEESRHQKYKLNMQKELSTLKAEVTTQKQKIKLLQEEMKRFNQAFAALTQEGIDCPEKLRDTLTTLNCLCSKLESLLSSEKEDDPLWLTAFSQELQTQWEHYRTTLDNLMDLQQHTDTLLQDKLEADLRNISLSAELDSFKGNITLDESGMDGGLEGKALEEKEDNENEDLMLKSVREENKVLKQCLDNKSLLLRLERLHLSNPKPNFEREMSLCLRERKVVMQVVRKHMEQFMAKWKQCAETHPSLPALVEALADCVEDLGEHLLGFSNGDDMSAEVVVRCLQQAMVRGVSKEYQEAISATLETLRQDLNHTLHHITLPSSLLDTPKLSSSLDGTSLQDTTQRGALFQGDDTQQDSLSSSLHKDTSSYEPHTSPQALTAKVEHLINVRTALVDAANEFNEELEEVLGQHLAPLKEQLQDVVKDRETSVREEVSSLPALPEHQTFIQEFTGFTSRVSQEAHTEKLQVLRNQQEMVHKILEDNQAKLSAVCHAFLESLHGLTSVEEMEAKGRALVDNLERTLAEEAMWVEKQYRDLLEHYTQEQDNNNQAHTLTCSHLVHTLTLLLHSNKNVSEPKELRQEHTRQVEQLCEEHEEEIQRLEAQLAAKDQETLEIIDEEIAQLESDSHHSLSLRDELSSTLNTHFSNIRIQVTKQHLQGLYNDRDWYKKTVGLLSHVTLQLLHYYSVAQSLTHQPQEDAASPPPHPPESPTPGRILDLSFLSDCVGEEEEEMLAFSEDRALATGLMGRTTMGMEGEVEDAESALDGTAVSEGMMDDLDKDEQVRALLERSYPQLMAILKGRWDRVLVVRLEKEVQELTISLQASAGMLRIFIHSVSGNENDLTPRVLRDEVQEEGVKSSVLKVGHSESMQEDDEQKKESDGILDFSVDVQQTTATKDITVPPSASILQQDLSCISEGLMQLLSQEESLPSFITLAPHDLQDKEQLRALLRQLCEAAQATASLKLELHHTQGLQQGLEEERHNLQEEVNRLTHYNKNLAGELQVLKDQLEETGQENQRPVSHYAAKMEATKDVRERVRVALSAKNVAELERGQLEARVRELEGLLEAVVRESETALETLRAKETDLSQQLEVADRQLKSARQFLEEHASDRDQEVEELVAARDKLTLQLRERDAQLVHHASQEKEVENLERQLWKKSEELQEALSKKEELQVENRASKDKICDLREIIQSLESQVDSHCIKEAELHEQVQELADALTLAKQQAQHLSSQVEELQPGDRMQVDGQSADDTTRDVSEAKAEGNVCQHNVSLLSELQEDIYSSSLMFRQIEKRLRDTTRGLEAMQLSGSLEDISAQDVEVTVDGGEGRLSPSTVDRRLEDQLVALECTTEVAIKRNKDLQITIQNLQAEFEEITAERDTLQERSREQLVKISSLEARLDEVRRADHPAAADMRQRLALLQEDLEEKREELTKKSIEVEELKHSLSSLREQLTNREGELQQLQSASLAQPHSLPQTAQDHLAVTHAQLEKDLAHKTHLIQSLQKELSEIKQPSSLSPSLAEDLILDKNAEISELSNKVKALMCAIQKVYLLIRGEGNLYEAQQVLSGVLGKEFVDSLNESEEQELLRRGEPEQMPSLVHDASIKEAAVIQVSPVPLQMSSKPGEDSVHTQPSLVEFSLMSAQTVPPPELSQVSEVTEDEQPKSQSTSASEAASSHTDSQAHLEEDFKAAQELLEAREAEILQLTEEVEDAPPMPLSTPIPQHPATQEMTTRLKAYEEQVDHLSAAVQRKSEEMQQLSTQLEHVHAEMKERLFEASREAARIEQQFQQQILDLKEQHIAREKKLCQDYEERVAKQVEDVAQRINKNKEAAMARQQEVFEATLRQAVLERDQAQRELEQWRAASASPSPAPQVAPPSQPPEQQTATQLCASVDALVAGLKQELEKAGQLDLSMASLMRAGEGEASTRASSVVSDASDGEEPASINGRIQQLMSKIHKDGIEVLSLIDIMFLCKHCTQLDTSQRSFIASSGLMASSLLERGSTGEQTQLMRNLAAVEEELAKMEQEMKRKIGVLEFQLEQERMSGSEWKLSFESEKQHSRDLMEQLRKERLTGAEHVSELTLLRSQLLTIRLQLQKLQEENISLSECQENKGKQIENLQAALQVERSNFSRVSKVLSEERKVSGLTQAEQEAIIKDLRNSLENERGRIVALCSHLERMTSQHSTQPPTTATPTPVRHLKKSNPSRPTIEELQVQLAVERERCGELERACERERLQAVSQKEQAAAERVQSKIEVRKAEGRLAELTRTIRSLETEKQRLVRQMSHEKERLQHQDSRIKELEGEVRKLEADSRAQSEVHQVMAERMREESTQLHVAYTRALTKLGEVEAEVCELRHKLRSTVKELQMAREHEEQLKQDLHSARTAVDRMGLPTLFRMVNQDGCSDLQVKANLELCRSMLQLTDDQRALRARIVELEDTVTSLNQQLLQAQESNQKNSNIEEKLKTERQVWETEKASLQHMNQQYEAEVRRLRAEKNTHHSIPGAAEMQQLYGRYLQSEHWRKALVWQKQYLMLVIKGYSDTEQHTLARLTAMATSHIFPSSTSHSRILPPRRRFRVAVVVVVATCRMKNLVLRFHRKKRLCVAAQAAAYTTVSSPENSRPQSSSSVVRGREVWPSTPQAVSEAALSTSFTGLTPPTREPSVTATHRPLSATHRSLFQEDSEELNQYVERLDNIHSVLGLTHKRQ